jgi:hypothetical protein
LLGDFIDFSNWDSQRTNIQNPQYQKLLARSGQGEKDAMLIERYIDPYTREALGKDLEGNL